MVKDNHSFIEETLNIPVMPDISLGAKEVIVENLNDDFWEINVGRPNPCWKYPESVLVALGHL